MPYEAPDRYDLLLTAQWHALRAWAASPPVIERLEAPSVLTGWTVRELLVHLGRSFLALEAARPAPEAAPLTLLRYVTGYAKAAEEIAEGTRDLADELAGDLFAGLDGLDALAARGFTALARLRGPIVRGPRGVLLRSDFVVTRIVELVVHGDDLSRSLPALAPAPLLPEAVDLVTAALDTAYRERTGNPPPAHDGPLGWIRAATGRVPAPDPALPIL